MTRLRRRREPRFPWRPEYDELARFNTQVSDGLVHTPEKRARMKELQAEYDEAMARHHAAIGVAGLGTIRFARMTTAEGD